MASQNKSGKSNRNQSCMQSNQSSPDNQSTLAIAIIVSNSFRSYFFDVSAILAKQCQRVPASYLIADMFQVSVLLFVKLCHFF